MLAQDLHIHTTWSQGDGAVVPEQSIELIASVKHARVVGISDPVRGLKQPESEPSRFAMRHDRQGG